MRGGRTEARAAEMARREGARALTLDIGDPTTFEAALEDAGIVVMFLYKRNDLSTRLCVAGYSLGGVPNLGSSIRRPHANQDDSSDSRKSRQTGARTA